MVIGLKIATLMYIYMYVSNIWVHSSTLLPWYGCMSSTGVLENNASVPRHTCVRARAIIICNNVHISTMYYVRLSLSQCQYCVIRPSNTSDCLPDPRGTETILAKELCQDRNYLLPTNTLHTQIKSHRINLS